jgi:hypothetical protein
MEDLQTSVGGVEANWVFLIDFWKSKQTNIALLRRYWSFMSVMIFIIRFVHGCGCTTMDVSDGFHLHIRCMSRIVGTDVVVDHTEVSSHLLRHPYS